MPFRCTSRACFSLLFRELFHNIYTRFRELFHNIHTHFRELFQCQDTCFELLSGVDGTDGYAVLSHISHKFHTPLHQTDTIRHILNYCRVLMERTATPYYHTLATNFHTPLQRTDTIRHVLNYYRGVMERTATPYYHTLATNSIRHYNELILFDIF